MFLMPNCIALYCHILIFYLLCMFKF
uniref:Uncharacterized protein n=1 Tax=Anguilla anguilla TaxID=7936 RepID=A0A0E9VZH7_ANGAN